ncbi:MAG TPA: T9SS type A sorting domain-containing protein [Bacteroidales bacterium]|nr:T9SS type A sorting domain-containing protein [Bacteroidales bacterium]
MKTMKHLKALAVVAMVMFSYFVYSQATKVIYPSTLVNDNCIITLPVGTKLILGNLVNQNGGQIVNKGEMYVSGNWENTGVVDIDDGYVYFNGNSNKGMKDVTVQEIKGNTKFNFLTVNSGSYVDIISGNQEIKSILKCDGEINVTPNGALTLLSINTQTALIDGSGSGDVYGTVTQQRFIPAAKMKGYKHFCSAFSDATFAQIANFTTLNLGTINDNPYPTVLKFSEQYATPYFSNGWVAAAPKGQTGNLMEVGVGYTIQMGSGTGTDKLTYLSGTVNNGDINVPITKLVPTSSGGNGWNLVGNPYPSPIDLHKLPYPTAFLSKSVSIYISTTMYNGYYGYYNANLGLAMNGGTRYLPALHSFFIQKTTNGTGTLTFTNSMRTNTLNPTLYKADFNPDFPFIKLSASLNEVNAIADEAAVMFINDATTNTDADYDASKIMNTDPTIPNLYSTNYNENYAINALPNNIDNNTIVPLGFAAQTTGQYTIKALDILNIPAGINVYLEDLATGKLQDLQANPVYTFTANQNEQPIGRFFLKFAPNATNLSENTNNEIYHAWSSGNTLFVSYDNPAGLIGKLRVTNMLGQEVMPQQTIANGMYQFNLEQPTGYYMVNFTNETTVKTIRVYINH